MLIFDIFNHRSTVFEFLFKETSISSGGEYSLIPNIL